MLLHSFTRKAVGEISGIPRLDPKTVEKINVDNEVLNFCINCPLFGLLYTPGVTGKLPFV
jgi:hypothetical protein